ncbi:MAG TPA: SdrD B-like domain-containing protein [Symbiobacteriaceae bacterium]|nr:SdrD B-like domain-containing protein [Symbiobacteriaceae bacterium]
MRRSVRKPAVLIMLLALFFTLLQGTSVQAATETAGAELITAAPGGTDLPPDLRRPCFALDLSTGTSTDFVPDPFGASDPDWWVTATPVPSFLVPAVPYSIAPHPAWFTTSGANWIDPYSTGYGNSQIWDPAGDYVFANSFNLNGALYTNFVLTVNAYAGDNKVQLVLDGNPIGSTVTFNPPGAAFAMPVAAGAHTLEAKVWNGEAWMGLLVDARVTADCRPDLTVAKKPMDEFVAGQPGSYQLVVTNVGAGAAAGPIYVTDVLPTGATFIAAMGAGWTCTSAGGNVNCVHPGPLPAGTSLPPIIITVTMPQSEWVMNCAVVDVKDDLNPENNRFCVETPVDPGRPASICGTKFLDVNGNGVRDPNEQGLGNWTILLKDSAGNVVATVVTNKDGSYCFKELKPGSYTVSEVQQTNWVQTAPAAPGTYAITLQSAQAVVNFDFGNRRKEPKDCCLTFQFPQGRVDQFSTAGNEPATPSAGLIKFLSGFQLVGYDYPNEDHYFATTFTLPQGNCIQSATLRFRAKPIGAGLVGNDAMALRFVGSGGSLVPGSPTWGAYYGSGNPGTMLLANPWTSASYPNGQWFTLNLGSLPGGGNVVPWLNSLRFIDLLSQDDTSIDYAVLNVTFCECPPASENPNNSPK